MTTDHAPVAPTINSVDRDEINHLMTITFENNNLPSWSLPFQLTVHYTYMDERLPETKTFNIVWDSSGNNILDAALA